MTDDVFWEDVRAALEAMNPIRYVELALDGDTRCPNCRSGSIFDDGLEFKDSDRGEIEVKQECRECRYTWYEEYHLVTYSELKPPGKEREDG